MLNRIREALSRLVWLAVAAIVWFAVAIVLLLLGATGPALVVALVGIGFAILAA